MRVLVTGANGFVGKAVCTRLADEGHSVYGAVRRVSARNELVPRVTPVIAPDVSDVTDWRPIVDGYDAVVHLVARTHAMREAKRGVDARYRRVNVRGTQAIVNACRDCGVKRFLFLSSIKAVGEGEENEYHERSPCRPLDAYGRSKLEAERSVFQTLKLGATAPIVIRPPLVYGPGVRGNFRRLLTAASRSIPLPIALVNNARSMVFVDNLADAICIALFHDKAAGQIFHVADTESISTPMLVRRLSSLFAKEPRVVRFPSELLRHLGRAMQRGAEVDRLLGSLTVSTEKIQGTLGWTPPYSLAEGLYTTAQWYVKEVGLSIGQDEVLRPAA